MKKLLLLAMIALTTNGFGQQLTLEQVAAHSDRNDHQTHKFIKQRTQAKWLKVVGFAVSVLGPAVAEEPDLAYAGAFFYVIGEIMDIDAGKYANRLKRMSKLEKKKTFKKAPQQFKDSKYYQAYLKRSKGKSEKKKYRLFKRYERLHKYN